MTQKKFDLAKTMALKLQGQMKSAGVPDRFAEGSGVVDKREQRRRDQAAGLVPFACKLPADLVRRLNDAAASQEAGVNALVAQAIDELLSRKP